MDELDRKILSELRIKGYQKSTLIAPTLGVGERTIRRRIKAMISKGIIKIIAVPRPLRSGFSAWALIGIKVDLGSLSHVASMLTKHQSVYFLTYSPSYYDIMFAVRFLTIDKMSTFVNSELTNIEGILNKDTFLLTHPRKYYSSIWPSNYHPNSLSGVDEIDEINNMIIHLLAEDALSPVRVLKSKLGVSESSIRNRIKNMLDKEVFKIEVIPLHEALQYEVWAMIGINISRGSTDKVLDHVIKYPSVFLASNSVGRFNIILAVLVHDIDSLNQFCKFELARIKEISRIEIFIHNRPIKYHNIII